MIKEKFDDAVENNICIGRIENKSIFINELGQLFYCEMPGYIIREGEVLASKYLHPIEDLPVSTQKRIHEAAFT